MAQHPSGAVPYDHAVEDTTDDGPAFASSGRDDRSTWAPRRPLVDLTQYDTNRPGTVGWLVEHFQRDAVSMAADPAAFAAAVLDYCVRLGIDPYSHRWIAHAVTAVQCGEIDVPDAVTA